MAPLIAARNCRAISPFSGCPELPFHFAVQRIVVPRGPSGDSWHHAVQILPHEKTSPRAAVSLVCGFGTNYPHPQRCAGPANTPATATLYVAGTFNNWNPGSAAHALTRDPVTGHYSITLPASVTGTIEYKFTRGTWASGETGANNAAVANRRYPVGSSAGPVLHQVINWEDLARRRHPAHQHGHGQCQRDFHRFQHPATGPYAARVAVFAHRLRQ